MPRWNEGIHRGHDADHDRDDGQFDEGGTPPPASLAIEPMVAIHVFSVHLAGHFEHGHVDRQHQAGNGDAHSRDDNGFEPQRARQRRIQVPPYLVMAAESIRLHRI